MDFCWNRTSLLWDSQTLSSLMRQLACCSVAVDSLASEITDHRGFCPSFWGNLWKPSHFQWTCWLKKQDIPSKNESFYVKDMPDSFNCRSVYAIFEERFSYRNKLEAWEQEKKLQPHPSSTCSLVERPCKSQISSTGRACCWTQAWNLLFHAVHVDFH